MHTSGLHKRLASIIGERSYSTVASLTRTTPATARRYMLGHTPSVDFLQTLCERFEINAHWLLTGHGPMHAGDLKDHALRQANPTELMSAIARALESLTDRLDRLETFVQTQEARLRQSTRGTADAQQRAGAPRSAGTPRTRAGNIAEALTQRSPADADRADPPDHA